MTTGTCRICGGPTPPPKSNHPRKICDDPKCKAAVSSEAGRKNQAARRAGRTPMMERDEWRCSSCGETKPLNSEHFSPARRDPETGEILRFDSWCSQCRREKRRIANLTKEQHEKRKAANRASRKRRLEKLRREDPERYRELQRKWAEDERRYRRERPEVTRAIAKRYREKVRNDPVLYQRYIENQRIRWRLRQEQRGIKVRPHKPRPKERVSFPELPVAPLRALIAKERAKTGENREEIAQRLGIPPRYLYAWDNGEYQVVTFNVAERVLVEMYLNLWDVWDEDEYPEIHARLAA